MTGRYDQDGAIAELLALARQQAAEQQRQRETPPAQHKARTRAANRNSKVVRAARLDVPEAQALDRLAAEHGRTVSEELRVAARHHLEASDV